MRIESKEGFRALLACEMVGIVIVSGDGKVKLANKFVEIIFGYAIAEIIGQPIEMLIPEASAMINASTDSSLIAKKKDGKMFPVRIELHPYSKADDNIRVVFINDMTEKVLLEEKFTNVFHKSNEAKIFSDFETGIILDVNEIFCRFSGYTREELIGKKLSELEAIAINARSDWIQMMAEGSVLRNYETEFKTKRNQKYYVLVSAEQLVIGQKKHVVTSCIDITEQKEKDNALKASNTALENEAAELKWLNDAGNRLWRITNLQEGLAEILTSSITLTKAAKGDVQLYEPNRQSLHIVAHEGFDQNFLDYFREVSALDSSSCGIALKTRSQIIISDTEKEWAEENALMARKSGFRAVVSTPLLTRDGNPLGMISTHFSEAGTPPATALKRMELYALSAEMFIEFLRMYETMEKQYAELENRVMGRTSELTQMLEREKQLSDMKSRFVSTAAHEFRTPLATVLSSINLIEIYHQDEQKDKRNKHIERVKNSVKHLADILNDFLSVDKLEQGQVTISPEKYNLYELALDVIEDIKALAKPGQNISFSYDGEKYIIFDKQILKNVLLNLLSNAIKYSDEGLDIFLDIKFTDKTVFIKVEDNGIGIPENEKINLFSKFFRATNAMNIPGTGLGLNIVKKYVELLKGDITFTSKVNQGTSFTIRFPAVLS
ncbi:MAG TPA: PAS domain S-box protein [Chitinophagaceae bacterium]|nr:PAS domain S-box protein [Chitinophagaceae bacterium]